MSTRSIAALEESEMATCPPAHRHAQSRAHAADGAVPALVGAALTLLITTALGPDTPGALASAEATGTLAASTASYNVSLPLLD